MKTTRRSVIAGGLAIAAAPLAAAPIAARADLTSDRSPLADTEYRCYEIGEQKGIESIRLVKRAGWQPAEDQVLVRPRAMALNHRDLTIARGTYGRRKPENRVPVGDGAGEVVAVGKAVSHLQPGDRVTAPHFTSWLDGEYEPAVLGADLGNSTDGWLAERILLPARSIVRIPDEVSFSHAAAMGAAAMTAWTVLHNLGKLKSGDVVLTLGTGGVSIMALQIAKMNGARVAITSSSDEKLELARKLGADVTVNYRRNPEWEQIVKEETGGADIVVETVGLTTLNQSLGACAPNASIGFLGALGGRGDKPLNAGPMLLGNLTVKGITSASRRDLADLLRAAAANGLAPHIDRSFGFDEAVAAYTYLDEARHVGKILIEG